jgi:hypothetical protein
MLHGAVESDSSVESSLESLAAHLAVYHPTIASM